jgi:hypothetical protein
MQGRAAQRSRSLACPAATGLAALLGVSLGVLGWLSAQAATFGVAEHTHLTAHGMTTHRHDYAAPLAAGAGVAAVLAVLLLLLVHLSSNHPSSGPSPIGRSTSRTSPVSLVARFAPTVAALLFVGVEAVEFADSGTPVTSTAVVVAGGAGLQILAARVAAALTGALVHGIEHVSALPPTTTAASPHIGLRAVPVATRQVCTSRAVAWGCRAPPQRRPAFVASL